MCNTGLCTSHRASGWRAPFAQLARNNHWHLLSPEYIHRVQKLFGSIKPKSTPTYGSAEHNWVTRSPVCGFLSSYKCIFKRLSSTIQGFRRILMLRYSSGRIYIKLSVVFSNVLNACKIFLECSFSYSSN